MMKLTKAIEANKKIHNDIINLFKDDKLFLSLNIVEITLVIQLK